MNTPEIENPRFQVTMQDMFFLVGVVAAVLAVVAYIGHYSGFLWICLIGSVVMTAAYCRNLPRKKFGRLYTGTTLFGLAFLGFLMMFSVVIVLNCLLHFLLVSFAWGRAQPLSLRTVFRASTIMMLVSFIAGTLVGLADYQDLLVARERMKPISILERFHYPPPANGFANAQPLSENWLRLESELQGGNDKFYSRQYHLKGLHSKSVESFIKSPGFGVSRMFFPNPARIDSLEPQSIPFNGEFTVNREWENTLNYWGKGDSLVEAPRYHFDQLTDFVHPQTYGVELEPDQRIGFIPHAFHFQPGNILHGDDQWKLNQLQLISLDRFEDPVAYVLDHLPRMDQLADIAVETRPLNNFESKAMKVLSKEGYELHSEIIENELFAVGAILAVESCLQCHSVDRGTVLGAFSYRFDRD
jgi:hypothetical protein